MATEYCYALRARPAGPLATPPGHVRVEPASAADLSVARHGVIVYERPLGLEELRQYELVPVVPLDGLAADIARIGGEVMSRLDASQVEALRSGGVGVEAGLQVAGLVVGDMYPQGACFSVSQRDVLLMALATYDLTQELPEQATLERLACGLAKADRREVRNLCDMVRFDITADSGVSHARKIAALGSAEMFGGRLAHAAGYWMESRKISDADSARQLAREHVSSAGDRACLRHRSREEWAIFLADASEPGRFRYQVFSRDGFLMHCTSDTPAQSVEEALEGGFIHPDPEAPGLIFTTGRFQDGNEVTSIIAELSARKISESEADARYEAIRRRRCAVG